MRGPADPEAGLLSPPRLTPALVLAATDDEITVHALGATTTVPYADFFPTPRAGRVSPGHLVALAAGVVVWRWFDAVVLDVAEGDVKLWEPGHGVVTARPRRPGQSARPGSRAYLSAGLPGADWWVAGPAMSTAEEADVELTDLEEFLTTNDLL